MRPVSKFLTEHELKIMHIFWRLGHTTVRQVHDLYDGEGKPAYTSLLTAVHNLEKKGYLSRDRDGKGHVFRPKVSKAEYQKQFAEQAVDDVYDGKAFDLAVNLIENRKLSEAEIKRIQKILEDL